MKRSLFARMLLVYVLLLLPLMLTGLFIMRKSARLIRENSADNAILSLEILTTALDTQLGDIQARLIDYTTDRASPISTLLTLSAGEDKSALYLALRKTQMSFSDDIGASDYLSDIALFIPQTSLAFSAKMGVLSWDEAFYQALTEEMRVCRSVLILCDDALYVAQAYPFAARYSLNISPSVVIVAELSRAQLTSLLTSGAYSDCPTALYAQNTELLMVSGEGLTVSGGSVATVQNESQMLGLTLYRYLPYAETYGAYSDLLMMTTAFVTLSVPLFAVYAIWVRRLVREPVVEMLDAFQHLSVGKLGTRLNRRARTQDFQNLFTGFNDMAERLEASIQTIYEQEKFNREMERKQLQAQISPHFLYNAFFVLKHQILSEDLSGAASMADYMSEYFRFITRSAQAEIPLADEYSHAVSYLRIQRMRFRERLCASIGTMPSEAEGILVPKLILQPLLENAFAYGRRTDDEVFKTRICVMLSETSVEILVEDNGDSLTDDMLASLSQSLCSKDTGRETTALINIHRRLLLRYGDAHGLTLTRGEMGGLRVIVRIPRPK